MTIVHLSSHKSITFKTRFSLVGVGMSMEQRLFNLVVDISGLRTNSIIKSEKTAKVDPEVQTCRPGNHKNMKLELRWKGNKYHEVLF